MNVSVLETVFNNYISKFDFINSPEHDENVKWRMAAAFHDLMDPDGKNFVTGIREAVTLSGNFIDSASRYCFAAMATCAEKDEKAVRDLFRFLFKDDGGNLKARQKRIDTFIRNSNVLIRKHVSINPLFKNDQRSVMGYLFLYDPDHNYMHRAYEVREFAPRVGVFDDFGTYANFKLAAYYEFCDELVEQILKCEPLLEINRSRYTDAEGNPVPGMHPDPNLHILAFDIIAGGPGDRYNFLEGIQPPMNPAEIIDAQDAYERMMNATADLNLVKEGRAFYESAAQVGTTVANKKLGEGEIIKVEKKKIQVKFSTKTVSYSIPGAFESGALDLDQENFRESVKKYRKPLLMSRVTEFNYKRAVKAFQPYEAFREWCS